MILLIHSFFVRSLFVCYILRTLWRRIYWELCWSVVYIKNYIFIDTIQDMFYRHNSKWWFWFIHFSFVPYLFFFFCYILRILVVLKCSLFRQLYFYKYNSRYILYMQSKMMLFILSLLFVSYIECYRCSFTIYIENSDRTETWFISKTIFL